MKGEATVKFREVCDCGSKSFTVRRRTPLMAKCNECGREWQWLSKEEDALVRRAYRPSAKN